MKLKVRPDDASMLQMNDWLAELREDGCAEPPRGARRGARPPAEGRAEPPAEGRAEGGASRPTGMPGQKPSLNPLPPSSPLPPLGALCGL